MSHDQREALYADAVRQAAARRTHLTPLSEATAHLRALCAEIDGVDPAWSDSRRRNTLNGGKATIGEYRAAAAFLKRHDAASSGMSQTEQSDALTDGLTVSMLLGSGSQARLRNPGLPDSEQGAYAKYRVTRTDGSDAPGGKHHGDEYFVLNMTTDIHSRAALRAYAESCRETHPQLSADLAAKAGVRTDATPTGMSGGARDTLVKMIECGPLASGYIPSKVGRNELLTKGLACEVIVADGEIHYGATPAGAEAYTAMFGGKYLHEGKKARQARYVEPRPHQVRTIHLLVDPPIIDTRSLVEGVPHHTGVNA